MVDKRKNSIVLEARNFSQTSIELESHLTKIDRIHIWKKPQTEIDVYIDLWLFYVLDRHSTIDFGVSTGSHPIAAYKDTAIFVPPFTLVHWHVNVGVLKWTCYIGERFDGSWMPSNLTAFKIAEDSEFKSLQEIRSCIESASLIRKFPQPAETGSTAAKAKVFLDNHFREDFSVKDLAQKLNVGVSTLGKCFKQAYGLTPLVYRNKLRIFDSMKMLSKNKCTATEICYENGFDDYSRFYQQYKRYSGMTPSDYLRRKKTVSTSNHAELL